MAYAYWRQGMAEREAVFHLFFRRSPFKGKYTIHCGLSRVIDYLKNWRFSADELSYLASLLDKMGQPLFDSGFLDYLSDLRFSADLFAMVEGQVAFGQEPVIRVQGPLLQCQLIETPLINLTNFASLVATKATRVCAAAGQDTVLEFGLRRAQGPDGGLTASRASYIGGCESVSNTLAAMAYQIPPCGTMAHSWVMAFADELTAFEKFSEIMPDNAILLVDTYNTAQGVKNAIAVGKQLRSQNKALLGIRLDSGDLNELSHKARQMLDAEGFSTTKIIASGDLDEYQIAQLKNQKAPIDIWGVGTRLTTAWDQPALDMAYKLAAIRDEQGRWQYKAKRSDQLSKSTYPGIQQVRRFFSGKRWLKDVIYDRELGFAASFNKDGDHHEDLLIPVFKEGQLVYQEPSIAEIRNYCLRQLQSFKDSEIQEYPVIIEPSLQAVKEKLLG